MSSQNDRGLEGSSYRELRLLEEVESSPEISQRNMAFKLGIALGVANPLVKSLVHKGYIRATHAGWKRWAYNLTPAGLARKVQLTLGYADRFVDHYRRIRGFLREDLGALALEPGSRIAIYGTTDLAELVFVALKEMEISDVEFIDRRTVRNGFLGAPLRSLDSVDPGKYTKVIVAFSTNVSTRYEELARKGVKESRIVTLFQNSNNNVDPKTLAGGDIEREERG